jgi:serine/threonine protein kinase
MLKCSGTYGVVYIAHWLSQKKIVAVKKASKEEYEIQLANEVDQC